MWLSAYHSRDDVLRWNTKEVFGEGLHRRTAAIAGFLVRHATKDELSIHGDFLEQVATAFDHSSLGVSKVASPALWNIPNLLTQGRDARFRPAQRLRKPTVRLYVEPMDNGDLSVIFDLDEKDYVAEGMYDLPYYRRRPINEAFHVTGFYHYMRHATAPTTEAWSAAVAFHILTTLNDGINTLIKDTTEYCHVNLDAELFLEKHDTENRGP
jgi:hypothetical protein